MKQQLPSFELIPSLWGIIGFFVVFTMTVTVPWWMQPQQTEMPRASSVVLEDSNAFSRSTLAEPNEEPEQAFSVADHSGAQPYQLFCASCHGMPGRQRVAGLTGSDLFDGISERPMTREWILTTLEQGILEKGMLPMNAVLSEDQMEHLVSFLLEFQPEAVVAQNT